MKRTFGTELERYKGTGPGFGLLRVALAIVILFGHARWIANGSAAPTLTAISQGVGPAFQHLTQNSLPFWNDWKYPRHIVLVPMFFALSGFLVTGSALRTQSVPKFLTFRFLRIFPALVVEVGLSALVLGPLLTTWPLRAYFSDEKFAAYFGNIFGHVQFKLPGLFEQNPAADVVNINLWTLPAEFYCYLIVAAAMGSSLFYSKKLFSILFGAVTIALIATNSIFNIDISPSVDKDAIYRYAIVYYFFAGSFVFFWSDRIRFSLAYFLISSVVAYLLLLSTRSVFIAPLFVTYSTVYLGMTRFPRVPLLETGDYSYGIYLYGFPISQALVSVWPGFHGNFWSLLVAALTLTLIFSVISWHFLEKHFLSLKNKLPFLKATTPINRLAP